LADTAQLSEKEYTNGIFVAVYFMIDFKNAWTKFGKETNETGTNNSGSICIPLGSDEDSEEDWAAEGDVVERVDEFGDEVDPHHAVIVPGPVEHWTFKMSSLF
jgi:hypothetical protein